MKFALFTIAAAVYVNVVGAFVPQSKLSEIRGSIESLVKGAVETNLKSSISTETSSPVNEPKAIARVATLHKRWGIDNTNENEYWNDSRIHTFGNRGFFGAVSS